MSDPAREHIEDYIARELARDMAARVRKELGLHPFYHCLLCGADLVDHDQDACDAKMAAQTLHGIRP